MLYSVCEAARCCCFALTLLCRLLTATFLGLSLKKSPSEPVDSARSLLKTENAVLVRDVRGRRGSLVEYSLERTQKKSKKDVQRSRSFSPEAAEVIRASVQSEKR